MKMKTDLTPGGCCFLVFHIKSAGHAWITKWVY